MIDDPRLISFMRKDGTSIIMIYIFSALRGVITWYEAWKESSRKKEYE